MPTAAQRIIDKIREKPDAVIGLATGSTSEPLYAALVNAYNESQNTATPLDFSNVRFFTLDEYVGLSKEHAQSYHRYLHERLFNHINARPENIRIPDGNPADMAQECRDYEAAIKRAGGVDIWIVGIGENGHIGFNEPGSAFTGETRKVKLTESTRQANRRFFDHDISKVPTHAVSVGLGTLRQHAREILLLASGQKKSEAVAAMLDEKVDQHVPATMLSTVRDRVHVFADEAALATYHARQQAGRGVAAGL